MPDQHTALEAARITANRHLVADAGKMGFYMKLRVYPHELLRKTSRQQALVLTVYPVECAGLLERTSVPQQE
jgi:hypothetical protein